MWAHSMGEEMLWECSMKISLLKKCNFDKNVIIFVTDLVGDAVAPSIMRTHSVSAGNKILTTLHFLATGKREW